MFCPLRLVLAQTPCCRRSNSWPPTPIPLCDLRANAGNEVAPLITVNGAPIGLHSGHRLGNLIVLNNNHVMPVVIMMVVMLGMHHHHISLVSDNDGVSLDKRSKCQDSGTNYNNFHIPCIRSTVQLTAIPIWLGCYTQHSQWATQPAPYLRPRLPASTPSTCPPKIRAPSGAFLRTSVSIYNPPVGNNRDDCAAQSAQTVPMWH
jgi:hypothetical protein